MYGTGSINNGLLIGLYTVEELSLRQIEKQLGLVKGGAKKLLINCAVPIRTRKEQCNTARHKARQQKITQKASQSPDGRKERSKRLKEKWADNDWRDAILQKRKETWADPMLRLAVSDRLVRCWQNRNYRARMREALRHSWEDPEIRRKRITAIKIAQNNPQAIERKRISSLANWQNEGYRELVQDSLRAYWSKSRNRKKRGLIMKDVWQIPEYRERVSLGLKKFWANQDKRKKRSDVSKEIWNRPAIRNRITTFLRSQENRVNRSRFFIEYWANPENKRKLSEQCREKWGIESLNILLVAGDDNLKNSKGNPLLSEKEKEMLVLYAIGLVKEVPEASRKTLRGSLRKVRRLSKTKGEGFFMF